MHHLTGTLEGFKRITVFPLLDAWASITLCKPLIQCILKATVHLLYLMLSLMQQYPVLSRVLLGHRQIEEVQYLPCLGEHAVIKIVYFICIMSQDHVTNNNKQTRRKVRPTASSASLLFLLLVTGSCDHICLIRGLSTKTISRA